MTLNFHVRKLFAAIAFVAAMTPPSSAQEVTHELVDAGVLNHSTYGQGIEMRIRASATSQEGQSEDLLNICKHFAPSVIPYVIEKTSITDPKFIAVRVLSGNTTFGRYMLQTYTIEGFTCGNEM